MFYRLPTLKVFHPGTVYRRYSKWGSDSTIELSSYTTSTQDIQTEQGETWQFLKWISEPLAKRYSPVTRACGAKSGLNLLPDWIGKMFHPTNMGREVIASYVTWAIGNAMAERESTSSPACDLVSDLTCHSASGSKAYASAYSLYSRTADFCKAVVADMNARDTNTQFSQEYNEDTLDDVVFTISKGADADDLDETSCNTNINRILDGCDGDEDENPMNWKSGGTYDIGAYTYNIAPVRSNRPFPVPTEPSVKCTGTYRGILTRYNIRGAGWATWDKGQKTLRGNSTRCFGEGLTDWYFEYFDEPDSDGYEWLAKFNSPIWTEGRCFANNKVQIWSGGPSDDGCH